MIYNKQNFIQETIIQSNDIDTFMFHNPYNSINLNAISSLHDNLEYNGIIYGIYGKTYDKDKDEKLKKLYKLRALLFENYIEEDFNVGDNYCYMLSTDIPHRVKARINKGK